VLGTSPNCIATYAGDFAQGLIALDATVEMRPLRVRAACLSPACTLRLAMIRRSKTVLRPDELITAFTIPALSFTRRSLYLKIRDRQVL